MAKRNQKKPRNKNDKQRQLLTTLLIIKAVADIVEDIIKIFSG